MTRVKPGDKYFWQDTPRQPTERYAALLRWLDCNVPKDRWFDKENSVDTITYYFLDEADAVAFKLRFGL